MASNVGYPVRVEARLDTELSRWMWLVKWFLAIPHYIVLAFLWVAFALLSIAAFFAILFTGRYPRGIFDFNVGVMRWSWRVAYYAYGVMGTDRYPPFTLAAVPDYPAQLEVEYPERLSRGLVLVKWWLLALPHYLIVGIMAGGSWLVWQDEEWQVAGPGLIGILAFIAVVILAFSGRYPTSLFDFILGLNRWVLRVAGYASLMTDRYPPFRLDTGGAEPDGTMTMSVSKPPETPSAPGALAAAATPAGKARGFTAGSGIALAFGVLIGLAALGIGGAGGVMLWADQTQRVDGFVSTDGDVFRTSTHAFVAEGIDVIIDDGTPEAFYPESLLGDARVEISSLNGEEVFIGVARTEDAAAYLEGVGYAMTDDFIDHGFITHEGGAPAGPPAEQTFWESSSAGSGMQTITWPVEEGMWTLVAMNADGSSDVAVEATAGLEVPSLTWIAAGLLVLGGVLLLIAVGLVSGASYRALKKS